MGKRANITAPYQAFESSGSIYEGHHKYIDIQGRMRADSMIGVTTSMLFHPAWLDLSPQQRCLYWAAKYQYKSAADRPGQHNDNPKYKGNAGKTYIYLNEKIVDQFKIYGKGHKALYKDTKALIEHGFIVPVEREHNQRTIYQLISEWQNYKAGFKYIEVNTHKHQYDWVLTE